MTAQNFRCYFFNVRIDNMPSHTTAPLFLLRYPGLPDCGELPEDGNGVPEQVR